MTVANRSVRVHPDDWEAFRQLQFQLERQLAPTTGRLTQADVFRICVGSVAAVVAGGQVPHGWPPKDPRDG